MAVVKRSSLFPGRNRRALKSLFLATIAQLCFASTLCAQQPLSAGEYELKAAFLYSFTNFIEWPAGLFDGREPFFHLCLLGDDPFGPALDALERETSHGRRIKILRLSTSTEQALCQVLYISASESHRRRLLTGAAAERAGILTVSDMADFAADGGIIQFLMEGKRVRFAINAQAAQRAGLKISSKLLRLSWPLEALP